MGKHAKKTEDTGRNWAEMSPVDKAAAFDASHADPSAYAADHFSGNTMPNVSGTGSRHEEYMADPASYGDDAQ